MIELTEHPIDTQEVLRRVSSTQAGAVVLFLGTTREFTRGRQTLSLNYECYAEMAEKKLEELDVEAHKRWHLVATVIVHRIGQLGLGEASVAIGVSSAHRQDAFEAGKWLIDTLKEVVPIWKQENWADGTAEWVHPPDHTSPIEPFPTKQPLEKAE
ncbi:MAG TPA: molybdenum cofactor biosynthesis protein MoaE [Pirellulaceae bacterium]|nr:molybdenum cofactor biosynthesis protein MoaE [Pirellulaceae bacterium]